MQVDPLPLTHWWSLRGGRSITGTLNYGPPNALPSGQPESTQPKRLWHSLNELLGRDRHPASVFPAVDLHRFFDDKVAGVRTATVGQLIFTPPPAGCELRIFRQVTEAKVLVLIRALPDKQCTSDPLPTWLLKGCAELLTPVLRDIINQSLDTGTVPTSFKTAYIIPLLKKSDLDPADVKSYRPISNLSIISKLLERVVSEQLVKYLKDNDLLPDLQSAYRVNHSTETAVLKVLSNILLALDTGDWRC